MRSCTQAHYVSGARKWGNCLPVGRDDYIIPTPPQNATSGMIVTADGLSGFCGRNGWSGGANQNLENTKITAPLLQEFSVISRDGLSWDYPLLF